MLITVMGANGRVGRQVAELLLGANAEVRAIGRSEAKLGMLMRRGADPWIGDAASTAFLTEAFRGADAVFTMLPFDPTTADHHGAQAALGLAIVRAIRDSGVRTVVALSSLGADRPLGTGVIESLHAQELRLRAIGGIDLLILRPGYFFDNFAESLGLIRYEGLNGDAIAPHVPVSMVASRDVALAAAVALRERDFERIAIRELLGPRDLTCAEATRILGTQLGKPDLPYVQFPYDEMARLLVQSGFHPATAQLTVDMARGINEGRIASTQGRTAASTTTTRFEDYAGELAIEYGAMAAELV